MLESDVFFCFFCLDHRVYYSRGCLNGFNGFNGFNGVCYNRYRELLTLDHTDFKRVKNL